MDAVTYPNSKVVDFINEHFVALRLPSDAKPQADDFLVEWTPYVAVLDGDGNVYQVNIGFMEAENLITSLKLGSAKVDFVLERYDDCLNKLDDILEAAPQSHSIPEAIFYKGVAGYKKSGKAHPLKEAYALLQERYPDDTWAERAKPYRLL